MNSPYLYPVHERFYSWQGEGVHAGRAAFFIRLYGCPVKCPWCDSAGTWHPNYVPKDVLRLSADQLAEEAEKSGAPMIVITGGEPTIHDMTELCDALHAIPSRPTIHLETMGGFPIKGAFDWITLSPKWNRLPLESSFLRASEIKVIVEGATSLWEWFAYLLPHVKEGHVVWLHPEWSKRNSPEVLRAITEAVKAKPRLFRAGYQMHKLFQADSADSRSAPLVPLGGNPTLGM